MEGPRAPLQTELQSVVRFLDSHLRSEVKWSVTSEYPMAFSEGNLNNIRIITENDEVLSHAVLRPVIMKTPAGLFKVGAIGSVVTSTDHRGQGLSTKTLESCLDAARLQGCDFAILWTNLYDFYRRLGFELAGTEMSVVIDQELPLPASNLKFMDTSKVDPVPLHRLYSQHSISSMRTLEETRRYLQIPNMRIYTAWDERGVLKAYAIEGKGADLNGYLHEWGGGVSNLLPLFAHIRKVQNRPITVIVPQHSQNLMRKLQEHGLKANEGYLGMIKILNPASLFNKVKRFARAIGVDDFAIEDRQGKFYLGSSEGLFSTDSEQDMVKLLFGPSKPSEIHNFDAAVNATLDRVLPLQMWIWGWDSI